MKNVNEMKKINEMKNANEINNNEIKIVKKMFRQSWKGSCISIVIVAALPLAFIGIVGAFNDLVYPVIFLFTVVFPVICAVAFILDNNRPMDTLYDSLRFYGIIKVYYGDTIMAAKEEELISRFLLEVNEDFKYSETHRLGRTWVSHEYIYSGGAHARENAPCIIPKSLIASIDYSDTTKKGSTQLIVQLTNGKEVRTDLGSYAFCHPYNEGNVNIYVSNISEFMNISGLADIQARIRQEQIEKDSNK